MAGVKWNVLNKSVRGAAHVRRNVQCQDYSLCQISEGGYAPVVLAVSDGHGGSRYVRSAQGAVYACETAVDVAAGYCAVLSETDANVIKQLAESRIKVEIVKKWRQAVLEHTIKNPFSDSELQLLELTSAQYKAAVESGDLSAKETLFAAYGATLLLVILLKDVIICEQIGDGDILFLYKKGSAKKGCDKKDSDKNNGGWVVKYPLERDSTLFANETTSLCSLKAPFYFRHGTTYLYDRANMPKLIMLSTDGYANSFSSADDYHKAAADYYSLLKEDGIGYVSENLEGWLSETSTAGSGDDITIALAWR